MSGVKNLVQAETKGMVVITNEHLKEYGVADESNMSAMSPMMDSED